MKVNLPTEKQVIQEALEILLTHMEPLKLARFIAACNLGEGDYLKTKDQLFAGETVDSLYEKIQAFESGKNDLKNI
ncbi:hypothetical protein IQ264_29830 [Phormidium sp. LEGE 05292]|uniref:hypothetical protein n=1 Tax=[Phormidium] sp. LEGE 05292 TaxID=767427 RepID=UPI00187EEFCA|nr:hypothetical protein [Phormidium sp. LEGE 05292]MBE9229609.1 hypothetical protein [Phormidium sp. LEGE 05292]